MGKISKSDTTPEMEKRDAEARTTLLQKKCMHFEIGTWVLRAGIRGKITGMSKDGGRFLWVEWENGIQGPINNPNYRWRS